jgi:hypothetical protein
MPMAAKIAMAGHTHDRCPSSGAGSDPPVATLIRVASAVESSAPMTDSVTGLIHRRRGMSSPTFSPTGSTIRAKAAYHHFLCY